MFFRRFDHRKKGGGLGGVLRLFMSLIILVILGIGLLQAYKSFAGVDPLTVNPKQALTGVVNSDSLIDLITGLLTVNPSKSLEKAKAVLKDGDQNISNTSINDTKSNSPLLYKFAVIADSHTDLGNLAKAISQAKSNGAKFIIGVGDFSDVGTVEQLIKTREQYNLGSLPVYFTPGDHDLWDSRNKKLSPDQNFTEVFNTPTYQAFSYENTRFILIYNSDNYLGLDEAQIKWVEEEVSKIKDSDAKLAIVVANIPLFHPSSDHRMGKTEPKLKNQAEHLMSIFKRNGIDEVIAADAHFFSRYKEPTNELSMTVVGAVTSVRNPQSPRFVMVDVHEDGSYNIVDTEIK